MSVNTYSPFDVDVIVAGVPVSGFAEGSIVTVAYAEDAFSMKVGADGEVTRSYNPNRSGTITINLMGTSDSNDFLSGLAIADAASKLGTFPVMVKDNNGTTLAAAAEAWVQKIPDRAFEKEVSEIEWVLQVANLQLFVGGH